MLVLSLCIYAQDRGFKPVNVKIEGTDTKLYSGSYALIIGVSAYTNGWKALPGVNDDIEAVKVALESQGFLCTVVKDPNSASMGKAFGDFIAKYGQEQENRLLFYYAGHGHTVKNSYGGESGYIVPTDAPNPNKDAASFQNTAMEMQQIEIYAKRIQSKHAMFLFDACFSGSLFAMTRAASEVINYKTSKPVRQFITSGSAEETVPDKSIFRQQFVTAMTTNEADYNKDGYLTGTELGEFLQTNVTNYSYNNQHPQYGKIRDQNLDKGDLVFVLSWASKYNPINTAIESKPNTESKPSGAFINLENNPIQAAPNAETKPAGGSLSMGNKPIQSQAVSESKASDKFINESSEVKDDYGSIEITTNLTGAIYIDGKPVRSLNAGKNKVVTLTNITSGSHLLEVKVVNFSLMGTGGEDYSKKITVAKGQTTFINTKKR